MGSKRWMLSNGLGHLLNEEIATASRFVDLFSGSGAVAQFVATSNHPIKVYAYDLQVFSSVLAGAVISRVEPVNPSQLWANWIQRATDFLVERRHHSCVLQSIPRRGKFTQKFVEEMRLICTHDFGFPVTRAYGGHYFSRAQSLWIDAMRATLPANSAYQKVALSALIQAASKCAASPGHTAQPFQPTRNAKPYLYQAWRRDFLPQVKSAFEHVCGIFAKLEGDAYVADANNAATTLRQNDLVFLDPPYSAVHYSRFYHVLESIAAGTVGDVTGTGRYPSTANRPRSKYSVASESLAALDELLRTVANKGARALLTFPDHACSNGLSGDSVRQTAAKYFVVDQKSVANRFSTLGGTKDNEGIGYGRAARQSASELIFILGTK